MYSVYILISRKTKKHYIGLTSNLTQRLLAHNSGANRSTKSGRPWSIIYCEEFENKSDAYKREQQIKSYKGGEAIRKLLS